MKPNPFKGEVVVTPEDPHNKEPFTVPVRGNCTQIYNYLTINGSICVRHMGPMMLCICVEDGVVTKCLEAERVEYIPYE